MGSREKERHEWRMVSKAGSFLYLTVVNFNKALNEIPGLSRVSTFVSHWPWGGEREHGNLAQSLVLLSCGPFR